MSKSILIAAAGLCLAISFGAAEKCYHCFDSYNTTISMGSLTDSEFGDTFVRCDKNKNNWNTWNCPSIWPVCIIMEGIVQDHKEVVRTCAKRDFCSIYLPPPGVKVNYCQECNTTLCNDYPKLPDPPVGPGPLFTFNININLNLRKYLAAAT